MADAAETTPTVSHGRARWSWLGAMGLFLAALGPLLMFAGGLLWGRAFGDEVPFFLITAAIGLIGAFLVLRFGTWAKIVGVIAAILVSMALFWTAFGLFTPNSFFDFMPGVLVIPGALLAIVACISAIVAGRRAHRAPAPIGGERTGIRVVLGIVIALALLSGVLTFASRSTVGATEADLVVSMTDFEFDQPSYEIDAGSTVLVRNDDPFMHTFTVDALDIDETLSPGSEVLVEIPDDPGQYVLYCRPHTGTPDDPGEGDMAAELEVE